MNKNISKLLVGLIVAAGLFFGASSTVLAQEKMKVDPVHSNVLFRVKHMDVGYFFGHFTGESGTVTFDAENPENSKISLNVPIDSVQTFNEKRDNHLKGSDFFDAKQFPEMKFESTKWEKRGDGTYEVTGELTMHGETKTVSPIVQMTGSGNDGQGNFRRGFITTFNIKRSDFGIDYMPKVVSDRVKLIITVEGVMKADK
ncbi:MAG: YceI family protein [Myxococcota bacterium]